MCRWCRLSMNIGFNDLQLQFQPNPVIECRAIKCANKPFNMFIGPLFFRESIKHNFQKSMTHSTTDPPTKIEQGSQMCPYSILILNTASITFVLFNLNWISVWHVQEPLLCVTLGFQIKLLPSLAKLQLSCTGLALLSPFPPLHRLPMLMTSQKSIKQLKMPVQHLESKYSASSLPQSKLLEIEQFCNSISKHIYLNIFEQIFVDTKLFFKCCQAQIHIFPTALCSARSAVGNMSRFIFFFFSFSPLKIQIQGLSLAEPLVCWLLIGRFSDQ